MLLTYNKVNFSVWKIQYLENWLFFVDIMNMNWITKLKIQLKFETVSFNFSPFFIIILNVFFLLSKSKWIDIIFGEMEKYKNRNFFLQMYSFWASLFAPPIWKFNSDYGQIVEKSIRNGINKTIKRFKFRVW